MRRVLVTSTCGCSQRGSVAHRPTSLTTLIVLKWPPRFTRTSRWPRRTVTQCHPTRTRSLTTWRRGGLTIFVRLTWESEASRTGSANRSLVEVQLPTASHERTRKLYGPLRPASLNRASRCDPSKLVGRLV